MRQWRRVTPLHHTTQDTILEEWQRIEDGEVAQSLPVRVTRGKPLDVIGLKGDAVSTTREYIRFLQDTSEKTFSNQSDLQEMTACPCCLRHCPNACVVAEVFGAKYVQCEVCGHVFLRYQLSEQSLNKNFEDSDEHSALYTDGKTLETRMEQVIQPKIDWILEVYRSCFNQEPTQVIDVGAGGGHFVAGLTRRGYSSVIGFEINSSACLFAESALNVRLRRENFLTTKISSKVNLVTLWGLLEYTPQPRRFLSAAREAIQDDGMVVVEVPRYDSLSTVVQQVSSQFVARHLDPTSHMNIFSDSSIANLLWESGLQPIAAWYFGVDIYELLIHIGLIKNDDNIVSELFPLLHPIQKALDNAFVSDDLVIAAIARK